MKCSTNNIRKVLDKKYRANSDYVRNTLVATSAIFHDLGDKSNSEYLIKIIKDAIERGSNI